MTVEISLHERGPFTLCGFVKETSLTDCAKELGALWAQFSGRKPEFEAAFGRQPGFYGLMWKTQGKHYCYLIGVEATGDETPPTGAVFQPVPAGHYAVASIKAAQSAVDAWTEFYYHTLPQANLLPNAGHGFDFEYYPDGNGGDYELWSPVIAKA
jgi:predicted transcriptional regulator YdeE